MDSEHPPAPWAPTGRPPCYDDLEAVAGMQRPINPEDVMRGGFDRSKSLQEIEKCDWGEPTFHSSLVIACHRLRRIPLEEFTAENLRMMIGQKISLPILMPLAVEWLERETLACGDCYTGDLLAAVTSVPDDFWAEHADSLQRVRKILLRAEELLPTLGEIDRPTVARVLDEASTMLKVG